MSCEDQGYSLISDGCLKCAVWIEGKKVNVQLLKRTVCGVEFWYCPSCDASYGPV